MTLYRGPGGTGSATSDADTSLYQDFLNQTIAARDAALQAEINAELAETNAETAEANAETAEANAAASASAAATSASNAASSASSASSSASAAAASASEAAGYAASINPADLVHISGTETITGAKTFSQTITGSITGNAGTVTNGVYTTGDQTIAGTKTFSSNPILSAGTANGLAFLNASKVLTTGSALYFDGTNLGIGTSSPTVRLQVNGRIAVVDENVEFRRTGQTSWNVTNFGSNLFFNNGSDRMVLDSSGNVGIGTSSPASKLQIASGTTAENLFRIYQGGVYECWLGQKSGVNALVFGSGSGSTNEQMRIDSSGNLLVGTTIAAQFNRTSGNGFAVQATGELQIANDNNGLVLNRTNAANGEVAKFFKQGSQVGTITVTGSATSYNTSSDYRLKHDIAPMTGALARVAALKPCTYKWNADDSAGEGFIAHELAEVVPQCVTGEKDAVDAEGKPVYQGIDTSFLVATLTAAIQEQQAIIEQLKAQLTSVSADVAALKGA